MTTSFIGMGMYCGAWKSTAFWVSASDMSGISSTVEKTAKAGIEARATLDQVFISLTSVFKMPTVSFSEIFSEDD